RAAANRRSTALVTFLGAWRRQQNRAQERFRAHEADPTCNGRASLGSAGTVLRRRAASGRPERSDATSGAGKSAALPADRRCRRRSWLAGATVPSRGVARKRRCRAESAGDGTADSPHVTFARPPRRIVRAG